jgi:hypothetical protein
MDTTYYEAGVQRAVKRVLAVVCVLVIIGGVAILAVEYYGHFQNVRAELDHPYYRAALLSRLYARLPEIGLYLGAALCLIWILVRVVRKGINREDGRHED